MIFRSSSSVAGTCCAVMFGVITFALMLTMLSIAQGVIQKNPSPLGIHPLGSGDPCSLCNSSLGCALQYHESFPDMTPAQVQNACEQLLCANWVPSTYCSNWWFSGSGRAVVRAAWYNESAYCITSPSCDTSNPQPTSPPSPSVSGACCTAGVCTNVTSRNCTGGTYQGDYTFCTSGFCGACCSTTTCADVYASVQCSGAWQGSATVCGGSCGACAYNSTSCSYTIPSTCGYTYSGRGTTCGSTPGTTSPASVTGACCYTSGTAAVCQVGTSATCTTLSGTYQGDYTTCSTSCGACMYTASSHPMLDSDWTCTMHQAAFCSATFVSGQACSNPNVLGKCQLSGATCENSYPYGCVDIINPAYGGPSCAGTFDPTVDCNSGGFHNCYEVGHGGCFQTTTYQCYLFGGVDQGYLGGGPPFTCNVTSCPGSGPTPTPNPTSTTAAPPTAPPTSPAPTGSTYGTCCLEGTAYVNVTSAQCTALSLVPFSRPVPWWFPVVPNTTPTCSACCGFDNTYLFGCQGGLYYPGSTFTCASLPGGNWQRPSNPAATVCQWSHSGHLYGYRCNRCINDPSSVLTVSTIGTAPPTFVTNPPSDCFTGAFYNHTNTYSLITAYCLKSSGGLPIVTACTPGATTTVSLTPVSPSVQVWPGDYNTGNQIIRIDSYPAPPGPNPPYTDTLIQIDSQPWAIALYVSSQQYVYNAQQSGHITLTVTDTLGNARTSILSLVGMFPPPQTPQGWLIWSNYVGVAQITIDATADFVSPLFLGEINVRL